QIFGAARIVAEAIAEVEGERLGAAAPAAGPAPVDFLRPLAAPPVHDCAGVVEGPGGAADGERAVGDEPLLFLLVEELVRVAVEGRRQGQVLEAGGTADGETALRGLPQERRRDVDGDLRVVAEGGEMHRG